MTLELYLIENQRACVSVHLSAHVLFISSRLLQERSTSTSALGSQGEVCGAPKEDCLAASTEPVPQRKRETGQDWIAELRP